MASPAREGEKQKKIVCSQRAISIKIASSVNEFILVRTSDDEKSSLNPNPNSYSHPGHTVTPRIREHVDGILGEECALAGLKLAPICVKTSVAHDGSTLYCQPLFEDLNLMVLYKKTTIFNRG